MSTGTCPARVLSCLAGTDELRICSTTLRVLCVLCVLCVKRRRAKLGAIASHRASGSLQVADLYCLLRTPSMRRTRHSEPGDAIVPHSVGACSGSLGRVLKSGDCFSHCRQFLGHWPKSSHAHRQPQASHPPSWPLISSRMRRGEGGGGSAEALLSPPLPFPSSPNKPGALFIGADSRWSSYPSCSRAPS